MENETVESLWAIISLIDKRLNVLQVTAKENNISGFEESTLGTEWTTLSQFRGICLNALIGKVKRLGTGVGIDLSDCF